MTARTPTAKLVLLGEPSVGKSSILSRYGTNTFEEGKEPTIGAAYMARVHSTGGYYIRLEIWDTAGQERFRALAPMYYRNALAAIVVYDLTSATSFERAKEWVYELKKTGHPNVLIALIGNKTDLLIDDEGKRAVPEDTVASFVQSSSIYRYIETSAFLGTNIVQLFTEIACGISLDNIRYQFNTPNLNKDHDDDSKPNTYCTC